jgi:hypothetical protein
MFSYYLIGEDLDLAAVWYVIIRVLTPHWSSEVVVCRFACGFVAYLVLFINLHIR